MAVHKLTQRVNALERLSGARRLGPAAWIIREDGETGDQAIARYEGDHGPIGDRFTIIWQPVQRAPCHA